MLTVTIIIIISLLYSWGLGGLVKFHHLPKVRLLALIDPKLAAKEGAGTSNVSNAAQQ